MPKKNFLFLLSHQPNPRIVKQLNFFSSYFNITLIFFKRENLVNLNKIIDPRVTIISLQKIPDSKILTRLVTYIKSFFKLKRLFNKESFDYVMINNIDTFFLFYFSKSRKQKYCKLIM